MADVAAKLDEARALIERGWTQGTYARDATGNPIDEDDTLACSFCIAGAVFHVGEASACFDLLERVTGSKWLPKWNDDKARTKEQVLEAFREAADLARAKVSA